MTDKNTASVLLLPAVYILTTFCIAIYVGRKNDKKYLWIHDNSGKPKSEVPARLRMWGLGAVSMILIHVLVMNHHWLGVRIEAVIDWFPVVLQPLVGLIGLAAGVCIGIPIFFCIFCCVYACDDYYHPR